MVERYVRADEEKGEPHPQARPAKAWHAALADYFGHQPLRVGAEQTPNRHTLAELAFQHAHAGQTEALKRTLWDYAFIEARLEEANAADADRGL